MFTVFSLIRGYTPPTQQSRCITVYSLICCFIVGDYYTTQFPLEWKRLFELSKKKKCNWIFNPFNFPRSNNSIK